MIVAADITPDNKWVLTVNSFGGIEMWDTTDTRPHYRQGLRVGTHELKPPQNEGEIGGAALAIHPDGRRAVIATPGWVGVWDLEQRQCTATIAQQFAWPKHIKWLPDGTVLLGDSARVEIRDLATGMSRTVWRRKEVALNLAASVLAASADCKRLLLILQPGPVLTEWDLDAGKAIRSLRGHSKPIHAACYSEDGRFAYSVAEDQTLRRWNLATGEATRVTSISVSDAFVRHIRTSPDGRWLAMAGHPTKLWDLTGEKPPLSLEETRVSARSGGMAFSKDGKYLVLTGAYNWPPDRMRSFPYQYYGVDARIITLWDVEKKVHRSLLSPFEPK